MSCKAKDFMHERIDQFIYLDEEKGEASPNKRDALARSRLFSSLAEGMMDTILAVNPETGLVEYANKAALRLFDCQSEDLIGHSPDTFTHPETRLKFRREIINVSQQEGGWEGEIKNLRKNGEPFISWLRAFSLKDEAGLPWLVVVVYRDLTEEKNRQEQLLHAGQLSVVERRARETAHEFNNMTTILQGYIDFMLLQGGLSPDLEKDLKIIQSTSQRAASIARQLLDLTRQRKVEKIVTQLERLVQETLRIVSQDLKAHEIQTEIIHHQSISLLLDPAQISQVLLNLCLNAQQAMSKAPRKKLRIETGCEEDFAFLKVADTGCGIPEENLDRIFQPLFTTKNSRSEEKGSGNGLGLAISQKIIEDHGGSIKVQSRVGEGTVFSIYLPVTDEKKSRPQLRSFDLSDKMILVVDDEYSLRELIKKALELQGGRVDTVEGGKDGFQMLQEKKYDLVLLDLQLQDMQGEKLLNLINLLPEASRPVKIVMSGKIGAQSQNLLNDLDVFAILSKPFELEKLYATIAAALQVKEEKGRRNFFPSP